MVRGSGSHITGSAQLYSLGGDALLFYWLTSSRSSKSPVALSRCSARTTDGPYQRPLSPSALRPPLLRHFRPDYHQAPPARAILRLLSKRCLYLRSTVCLKARRLHLTCLRSRLTDSDELMMVDIIFVGLFSVKRKLTVAPLV